MQLRLDVHPLVGIGPVKLGASREAVRAAMGTPPFSFQKNTGSDDPLADAWCEGAFQVFYARSTDTAEFIEISRGGPVAAMLLGDDLLATPASVLIAKLDAITPYDRTFDERGYSFVFQDWQLALWRPVLPKDDAKRARYFATAGAAIPAYFQRLVVPIPLSNEGDT